MLKEEMTTACTFTKKALNGQHEARDVKLTVLAVPKSLCKINPVIADSSMKPEQAGVVGVAVLANDTKKVVEDIAK